MDTWDEIISVGVAGCIFFGLTISNEWISAFNFAVASIGALTVIKG